MTGVTEPLDERPTESPGEAPQRRPRGPRIVLYLVVVAALAFLLQRQFRVDAPLDERTDRLDRLETRWSQRVAEGETAAGAAVPRIVERWKGLRREGGRPWRIRFLTGRVPVDRPPAAPGGLRATLELEEETASIVLTWNEASDADQIVIHRSRGPGRSAVTFPIDGGVTSWRDAVPGLTGESVYWLQARRGDLRSPDSARVPVKFAIPHRLALKEVDLERKTATIAVIPSPAGFVGAEFLVHVDEPVGARTGSFDYTTAFRLLDVGEIEDEEMVLQKVARFAPDGTRLRDAKGTPVEHWRMMPVPRRRPFAKVRKAGEEPVTLYPDGR